MKSVIDIVREKAKNLPEKPGVYLWLNSRGNVLYIGKAKNLRARVSSYFRDEGDGRPQIPQLMSHVADIDYIVTDSEIEALVTEANLTRAQKPKYNVRLKDDKRYPYIKITKGSVPRIFITRSIIEDGSRYLGPYTDVKAVRRMVEMAHSIFPLRTCRHNLPSKSIARACLNYQMKRCSGPCCGYVGLQEYNRYIEDATHFIEGHNLTLLHDMKKRMKVASDALNFELAAQLRDRCMAIQKVVERRKAFSTVRLTGDWDVVNYYILGNEACVVIMEIRDGNILGKKHYLMSGVYYTTLPEILAAFLLQYYLPATGLPPKIHLPHSPDNGDNISAILSKRRGSTVDFVCPKRGEKARLLKMTATNAEVIMKETIQKRDRMKDAIPEILLSVKRDLKLQNPPRTIACIDISHIGGTDTVASLVFFRDGKPDKKEYRHFKIKTVTGIDDFKSMREVVERYFSRILKEEKTSPDLLIVDGGKGQLSSALMVLKILGLEKQPVAGLAKRLEEVFLPGASEPQNIPKSSATIHLFQRIRDEAHRFAVTYQRKMRKKRVVGSSISTISGIGPSLSISILRHFGSLAKLKDADIGQIAEVQGIGERRAAHIFAKLKYIK